MPLGPGPRPVRFSLGLWRDQPDAPPDASAGAGLWVETTLAAAAADATGGGGGDVEAKPDGRGCGVRAAWQAAGLDGGRLELQPCPAPGVGGAAGPGAAGPGAVLLRLLAGQVGRGERGWWQTPARAAVFERR